MSAKTASSTQFKNVVAPSALAALLLFSACAWAQVAPPLGSTAPFAVLGLNAIPTPGTVTCTDTGPGIGILGNVGSTGGFTNVGPCIVTGTVTSPVAAGVVADFNTARAAVNAQACGPTTIPIVTTTLGPGVYCSAAATTIGAGVIITLNGGPNDIFIFRVGTGGLGALTLTNAQVVMGGSANACNVYWTTAQAMTTTDSAFVGNVLSGDAVTMTNGSWIGRAFATTDATFTDPQPMEGCAFANSLTARVPTLSQWAMLLLAGLLAIAGFAVLRRQAR